MKSWWWYQTYLDFFLSETVSFLSNVKCYSPIMHVGICGWTVLNSTVLKSVFAHQNCWVHLHYFLVNDKMSWKFHRFVCFYTFTAGLFFQLISSTGINLPSTNPFCISVHQLNTLTGPPSSARWKVLLGTNRTKQQTFVVILNIDLHPTIPCKGHL